MEIDTSFDFRSDSNGKDPDAYSPTLRSYHRFLWSKQLPIGERFEIEEINSTLIYRFNMQTLKFGSDSISNSYIGTKKIAHLNSQINQAEFEEFRDKGSTIGGYLIFPSEREGGGMTINGARGFNRKIADRFDLTLECIRLHYQRLEHPLENTFGSPINNFFFSLFKDFQGYVDFFLLQDLVDNSYERVNFFTAAKNAFAGSPIPDTAAEYREYKMGTLEFVRRRNQRIREWSVNETS
ncbi:DUF6994 family protein [Candidatus Planktophila versatilis]|uniref:Uncharacterized protein n=1 Tax=Candidatus Planktophila versatilis TaxID=1884905 RepID=A0ABM6MD09_9ACTN|nr:hypothetical protein [Candidatus Planktophila versatilis]ASY16784.1 hypothetical protein A1sIA79_00670 [Candidatus Planktophila versatilis]